MLEKVMQVDHQIDTTKVKYLTDQDRIVGDKNL